MKFFKYSLVGSLVLSAFGAFAQGETCASARVINNLPYDTPFLQNETTCGKGNDYTRADRCGNLYMTGEEFMYEYTPANDVCVNATASPGLGVDDAIALFITEGCPDDVNGKCIAQFTNQDNAANTPKPATLTDISLEGGKTYYFQVTARTGCFEFTFNLETSNGCTPPATGYDCDNPEEITLPYDTTAATNCNRDTYVKEGNYCYSTLYNDGPTYIYKFTPTKSGCIKITGSSDNATVRFTKHNACPTYADTTCKSTYYFVTYQERTYYETVTAGETIYYAASTGATCSTYDLKIEEISDEGAICSKAVEITPDATGYYEKLDLTTRCMGDDSKEEGKCINSNNYDDANEIYFKYYSDGNECIAVTAFNVRNGSSTYGRYLNMSMFKDCPSAANDSIYAEACANFTGGKYEATIEYTITDPGWYIFVLSGYQYTSPWSGSTTIYDRDFDFRFSTNTLDILGRNCADADQLPATTSVSKTGISVQCKNDDYDPDQACDNPLIGGSDYVFVYTAPRDFCGTIVGKNVMGTGGLMLFDACPDAGANCLGATGCEVACDSIYMDFEFERGKKYYIVGAASSGNFFNFDISIRKRFPTDDGCKSTDDDDDCPDPADCDDCLNADFETGSFKNWKGFTGRYATPKQTPGLDTTYINDPLSRHTIMNAGGYDPVVGNNLLKTTGPLGGRYAVRLGNRNSGYEADVLTYEFTVTEKTKNFFYYYAVVFNDPSHVPEEQPFFGVEMVAIDDNGVETAVGCAAYEVRADPNDPTFVETYDHVTGSTSTTIRWKDWTLVTVPLDNFIGQDVRIEFTTKDCDLGGHYGYAYIDAFCGDIDIETNTGKYAICPGESLSLTAPEGFASYQWSTGATTREITVNQPGTYTVLLTPFADNPLLNCQVTLSQEVTQSDQPLADFSYDEGCIDQFIDFFDESLGSPEFPIESWHWNFGEGTGEYNDTNRTHSFPGPGTYDVQLAVINTGGCRDTTVQSLTIPEYPSLPPLNAIDTLVICQDDTIRLYADDIGGADYSWTGPAGFGSTDRTPLVTINGIANEGDYIIEAISQADTCVKTYDTTFIDVIPLPQYFLNEDTELCFLDRSLDMFASGGEDASSYTWAPADIFDNPNIQNPTATPDSTVIISVSTTHTYCPDSTMSMELTINYYEEMLELVDEIEICEGEPLDIVTTAGDPIDYLHWDTPMGDVETDEELHYEAATLAMNGYFYVTAYLDNPKYCEYAYDSVKVTVRPAPEGDVQPATAMGCIGDEVNFSVENPMINYTWTNEDGDTVGTDQIFSVVVNDENYYVNYTDDLGCTNRDTVFADEYEVEKPDLGKDRLYCIGDDFTIRIRNSHKMLPGYTYQWNTGETTDKINVTTTGDYILTASHLGCSNADTIHVEFQDPANFTMGNDTLLCEGDSLFFDFSGYGEEIDWNDGYSEFTRWVTYPGGFYSVEIESGACELEDDINVNFEDFAAMQLPNDTAICLGETLSLQASPAGQNYEWYDNGTLISTADNISISQEGNHNIILRGFTAVCASADTMLVTVLSPDALNFPDQHFCETDSAYIDATIPYSGATYTWGDGYYGPTRWVKDARVYTIQIIAGPCVIDDQMTVTHDVVPTFSLGADQQICEDNTFTFAPDNSSWPSYAWNSGEQTASKTTSTPGEHILTATNGFCSFSDTVNLLVDTIPTFELGPDLRVCETNDTVITTGINNPNITFLWNTGATTPSITVGDSGRYSVEATNGLCRYNDDVLLTEQKLPGVDLGPDLIRCLGDVASIGFTAPNATYQWSTGETTDYIDVSTTGTYTLTVNQQLCSESDQIDVSFDVLQKPQLGDDIVQCDQINTTLDAATVAQTYEWYLNGNQLPDNSRSISATQPGVYEVIAIQGTCEDRDTILVSIQNSPNLSVSTDSLLCQGELYPVTASSSNAQNPSFLWNTGETTPTITVGQSGVYSVTMFDGVCAVMEDVDVVFVPHPYIDMRPGDKICENDKITIGEFFEHQDTSKTNYNWNTGQNTGQITVSVAGRYVETASIEHCFDTDYFDLEVVPMPQPNMTPPFTTCANELLPINTGLPNLETTWNNGLGAGYSVIPKETGNYIATITDGPCTVQGQVFVTVNPYPTEEVPDVFVCPKDSVSLNVLTPNSIAIWNGVQENPHVAYPKEKITLRIINQFGCKADQQVMVYKDMNCSDEVFIPNSFTPNNDGVNETFTVSMSEKVIFQSFKVFNRWGEEIYSSEGSFKDWDGTHGGRKVQEGIYPYTFKYINQYDKPVIKSGHITVLP